MIEQIPAALDGERMDRVVALLAGCSRAEASRLVTEGGVRHNGIAVAKGSVRLVEGDVVEIDRLPAAEVLALEPDPAVVFAVVHADGAVIVVDKPPGLAVHPGAGNEGGTLANGLLAVFPEIAAVGDRARPGIVHRLDQDTSGLLMVARTEAAHADLVDQLARRTVDRRYLAVVWGHPEHDRGLVDAPIGRSPRHSTRMAVVAGGREARTHYEVIRRVEQPAPMAELRCTLDTGRTHQIRVHLSAIDHPVVGDPLYRGMRGAHVVPRLALHAMELGFRHPATNERMAFVAGPPADLEGLLSEMR